MQPSYSTYESRSKAKIIATVATIIVVAGVIILVDHLKVKNTTAASQPSTTTSQVAATPTTSSTNSASSTTSSTGTYKDGTYTASSSYYVPHGNENIEVTLTLNNGVVTSSSITNSEGDPDSASFQEEFASAYKGYVVGKQISGLNLGTISGASDTTQGFNDALNQIASQAQA